MRLGSLAGAALLSAMSMAAMTNWDTPEPAAGNDKRCPPDRLSIDRRSSFFSTEAVYIGVRFNGVERPGDVFEYCRSEGWIDVIQRGRKDRSGQQAVERIYGEVEPFWREAQRITRSPGIKHDDAAAVSAAEAKRQRKAAKLAANGL